MQEIQYLSDMSKAEQYQLVEKLTLMFRSNASKPLRFRLLDMQIILDKTKLQLFEKFKYENPKNDAWAQSLMQIPFGKYSPVRQFDVHTCLAKARNDMDNAVYGHEQAKEEALCMLCEILRSPHSRSLAIGLVGPPGIGKTTFAKSALACLGRPFQFISLCGSSDVSQLVGHSYTYEGAIPGQIVEALQNSETMDPVIFFDELCKVSDSAKGKEVAGVLTALTDPEQAKTFRDRYFHGVDIDLSRAIIGAPRSCVVSRRRARRHRFGSAPTEVMSSLGSTS